MKRAMYFILSIVMLLSFTHRFSNESGLANSDTPALSFAWFRIGDLLSSRTSEGVQVLSDGKVLITAGSNSSTTVALTSTEVFNPETLSWSSAGDLNFGRIWFGNLVRLQNEKVLIAGGTGINGFSDTRTSELFDPSTNSWSYTGNLITARRGASLTMLADGRVLISGGSLGLPDSDRFLYSAEIYNPETGTWISTGNLKIAREGHKSVRLFDDRVLIIGGEGPWMVNQKIAEIYRPNTGDWVTTGSISIGRNSATLTLLQDGRVMYAGGAGGSTIYATTEIYEPATGMWSLAAPMNQARAGHSAILLPDGKVLVIGGGDSGGALSSTEIYDPVSNTWQFDANLNDARGGFMAATLLDGRVLAMGGQGINGELKSTEIRAILSGSNIFGRVTDSSGNGVAGVAINAMPDSCVNATAIRPVLLVNGFGGSETKVLSIQDENIRYITRALEAHGYIEGCNLFFAHGTSPKKTQAQNAEVIRDELCRYHAQYKEKYDRIPVFNIIGHSYGGLRSRAYLESDMYDTACPEKSGTTEFVRVDNLITLGSPHGGEWGDLPLATLIGLGSLYSSVFDGQANWPALYELLPPVRLVQNLNSQKPLYVDYYLVNGDARVQFLDFNLIFKTMVVAGYNNMEIASDMAVSTASGYSLSLIPWKYPDLTMLSTVDIHGRCDDSDLFSINGLGCVAIGLNSLKSYLDPSATFPQDTIEEVVWPILQASNVGTQFIVDDISNPQGLAVEVQTPRSLLDVLSTIDDPVTIGNLNNTEISSGVLPAGQTTSGTFTVTSSGINQVHLGWLDEELSLKLVDPLGHEVSEADPGVIVLSTTLGMGWTTIYHFEDMATGVWSYEITGDTLTQEMPYRLRLLPSVPVFLSGTLPQWQENAAQVQLTAKVFVDETTILKGAAVQAKITLPDGTQENLDMLDDGANGDGAAGDGVYGLVFSNTTQGGLYSVLLTAQGTYNTEPYLRNASGMFTIAPLSASMEMTLSDRGVDENLDGFYEWLEIDVPVTVNTAGSYSLSGELYAGTTYLGMAKVSGDWTTGELEIPLRFTSQAIVEAKIDGPYFVRNLLLVDETETTILIQAEDPYYQTTAYSYLDFYTPRLVYLPQISMPFAASIVSTHPMIDYSTIVTRYSVLTDSYGFYTLSGLPVGTYVVWAAKDQYEFTPSSIPVTLPPNATGVNFSQDSVGVTP